MILHQQLYSTSPNEAFDGFFISRIAHRFRSALDCVLIFHTSEVYIFWDLKICMIYISIA